MTRRDDDIPAELRDVAAQLRALGPEEWEPAAAPPLRPPAVERPRRRFGTPFVLRPAMAVAAAVGLLALGAAGGALLARGGDGDRGPRGRPRAGGRRPARRARRCAAAQRGHAADRGGLPPVGGGGFYEVWMMRDATHLVALGSFRVGADGRARVDLPVTASPRRFPVLDISREPADGDPAHSGHSVLRSRPIDS